MTSPTALRTVPSYLRRQAARVDEAGSCQATLGRAELGQISLSRLSQQCRAVRICCSCKVCIQPGYGSADFPKTDNPDAVAVGIFICALMRPQFFSQSTFSEHTLIPGAMRKPAARGFLAR